MPAACVPLRVCTCVCVRLCVCMYRTFSLTGRFSFICRLCPTQILAANPEIKTFKAVFGDLMVDRGPPRPPGGGAPAGAPTPAARPTEPPTEAAAETPAAPSVGPPEGASEGDDK